MPCSQRSRARAGSRGDAADFDAATESTLQAADRHTITRDSDVTRDLAAQVLAIESRFA